MSSSEEQMAPKLLRIASQARRRTITMNGKLNFPVLFLALLAAIFIQVIIHCVSYRHEDPLKIFLATYLILIRSCMMSGYQALSSILAMTSLTVAVAGLPTITLALAE
ncbi:hypothetical protein L218DRAFT_135118 [Marasmius fiardii PR-910]|nr:hypothetical protein L218DRAFT_135118 [Marasmius fiardii PR-910]